MSRLSYFDFAIDEITFIADCYSNGIKRNPLVSHAQRACELYMKHLLTLRLMNNSEVMSSHNLRELYEYIEKMGIDLSPIRTHVMTLNNFYTHTRYPGRESFIATEADIDAAYNAIIAIAPFMSRLFK